MKKYLKRPCTPTLAGRGIVLSTNQENLRAFHDLLHHLHADPPASYPVSEIEDRHQLLSSLIETELERIKGTTYPASVNLSYRLLVDILDVYDDSPHSATDKAILFKNTVHNAILSLEYTW